MEVHRPMPFSFSRACRASVVLLLFASALARAQSSTGSLTGTVTDSQTKAPLAGALVLLEGTPLSAATDRAGVFRITGAPAGSYELLVTYLGHADARTSVTVTDQTLTVHVELGRATYSETVMVSGRPLDEGQAQALNQQKTAANIMNVVSADQIGSFPDPNGAEAASRIPGVSISRDQGEGRYILVRGTEARLNAVLIDGERIPSPEDTRQIMLDVVPADQLQSIELSKAVTPDMDADSIGGAVNLITKQAVGRPTALFSAAGGYNALQRSGNQQRYSASVGRRFGGGRFGLLASGSASILNRGSENFEAQYSAGALADLQLRDYQIRRERYGLNVSGDTRLGANGSFTVRSLFNEFQDYEVNNRQRFRPGNSRIEHVLKNRNQQDHIRSVSGTGQHLLGSGTQIDYRLAWAHAREEQPDRLDTIFRQSRITFNPNVSATSIDPDNIQPNPSTDNPAAATLNAWQTEVFDSTDRDVTASFNVRTPLSSGAGSARFLKFGVRIKDKHKDNALDVTSGAPVSPIAFPQLQDTSFDNARFLRFQGAGYPAFPGIDAGASRALFNALPASRITVDREADTEDYSATEQVYAGYVMAELFAGEKLLILPGIRFESTTVRYNGQQVVYDNEGDYASTAPVAGGDTYGFLLPGVHLKYAFDPSSNLRVAYTRTLARPNYFDLVPYELVLQEDGEINRGNPALRPTTSSNLDVLVERYFRSVGTVAAGVFHKQLRDYIYAFRTREAAFGDTYQVTQPRNGDHASLTGVEFSFQNQLRFLPAPFDGLGLYGNVTLTRSTARFPDRTADARLPGQSGRLGNVAVSFEKGGFSARTAWNFRGRNIDLVGSTASADVYYDTHVQWDLSFSQRLTRQARAYADVLNLTNRPLRYYEGSRDRPIQEEYYRSWATVGVKFNF